VRAVTWAEVTATYQENVHPDERCSVIASTQFGLINLAQTRACRMRRAQVNHRLETGRWRPVLPTVYCINGSPSSWEQDAMGACLWAGEGAALSHKAAARRWDFNGFANAPVEISTIKSKRNVALPFLVHRVSPALVREIETLGGLPVTSVRRTILDLTETREPRAERVLDQAIARDLTSLGQMWLLYEEEWTRGRRGIAILRARLSERTPGRGPDDSELELLLEAIIRDFALPEPFRQRPVSLSMKDIRVDYCYPDARLIIEADSYAFHGDRSTFNSDRERDAELQLLGWRVLRFTWAQLRWQREWVAEMIRLHLDAEW
jgi:very-short-patch-repair endonuclease